MIKAEELRIGNWVNCKIYNGNKDVDIQFTWQEAKYIHLFEPIPLTPEILEQAGFKERKHLDDWFINLKDTNTLLVILIGFDVANICPSNQKPCLYIHCGFLHQLQNLFYALSGTELTIKP